MSTAMASPAEIVIRGTPQWDAASRAISAKVGRLQQGANFDPKRIERWTNLIIERENGNLRRCHWHLRRLTGIGGAEIGGLVDELRGEPSPFKCARQTVGEKLLAYMPEDPSDDMLRGIRSEDVIRSSFHAMVGGRSCPSLDRMGGARHPVHRWMISTPDDFVIVGRAVVLDGVALGPGDRILVDYKCPSSTAFPTYVADGVPSYWKSQLHQYDELSRSTIGGAFKARFIVMFDLDRFVPHPMHVPYDASLVEELISAGTSFWNDFVMKGELPPWPERRATVDVDVPEDILEAAADLGRLKALEKSIETRQKAIEGRIKVWAEEAGEIGDGKIKLGDFGTLTGSPTMNTPRLVDETRKIAMLSGANIDVDAIRLPDAIDFDGIFEAAARKDIDLHGELRGILAGKGIDLDKFWKRGDFNVAEICRVFQQLGGDPSLFLTEKVSLRLSVAKKGIAADIKTIFATAAEAAVEKAVAQVRNDSLEAGKSRAEGEELDLARGAEGANIDYAALV